MRSLALSLAMGIPVILSNPAAAQTVQFGAGQSVAPDVVSCAPSNNGTGHLVCAEMFSGSNTLQGVSWQTPPFGQGAVNQMPLGAPAPGLLAGRRPGCGSAADGTGTALCALEANDNRLYGVAFYPPAPVSAPFLQLGGATFTFNSDPSCTIGGGGRAICAVVANGQLFGIAFDSRTGFVSGGGLQPLNFGGNFTSNPSCTSVGGGVAICAIRQGGGLLGFAFGLNGTSIQALNAQQLGGSSFAGSPSCVTPQDGSGQVTCGILTGGSPNTLVGFAFDPRNGFFRGFQNLLTAPMGNFGLFWPFVGNPGCAASNDPLAPGSVTCAVVTSISSVFAAKFNPRSGTQGFKTLATVNNVSRISSCITLAMDPNQITCAFTSNPGPAIAGSVVTAGAFDVPF